MAPMSDPEIPSPQRQRDRRALAGAWLILLVLAILAVAALRSWG